jgi:hypothetical protein
VSTRRTGRTVATVTTEVPGSMRCSVPALDPDPAQVEIVVDPGG